MGEALLYTQDGLAVSQGFPLENKGGLKLATGKKGCYHRTRRVGTCRREFYNIKSEYGGAWGTATMETVCLAHPFLLASRHCYFSPFYLLAREE